jgi:sialate O-acetylesterase
MTKKKLFLSVLIFSSLLCKSVDAAIVLPSFINSGMVLQQKAEVNLWGKSTGKSVTIITSWNRKTYIAKPGSDGSWKIKVTTPLAGGPYEITFNDGSITRLTDILIGEVWLASGQSNMEMPVAGFKNQPVINSIDILMDCENDMIRLFHQDKISTGKPLNDGKGKWEHANAGSVKDFSAVAYLYVKILQEHLKVPVGVIETAWGGTRVEAWMSRESLNNFTGVKLPDPDSTSYQDKNTPTGLFNGMIAPFVGYGIGGVIWYQGEQNRLEPLQYSNLFPAMVKEWRKAWGTGEWPFYYVQIAPYTYRADSARALRAAQMREVQLNALASIPNSGIALAMDVGDSVTIHPPDKYTISKRLAYCALAKTYGKTNLPFSGPVFNSMKIENSQVTLKFDHAENGLTSFGKTLSNFEIAGEDKIFYPARARVTRDGVLVAASQVKTPVAVRYAFKPWVKGDLYNTEGLPASSFRTDKWDIE